MRRPTSVRLVMPVMAAMRGCLLRGGGFSRLNDSAARRWRWIHDDSRSCACRCWTGAGLYERSRFRNRRYPGDLAVVIVVGNARSRPVRTARAFEWHRGYAGDDDC